MKLVKRKRIRYLQVLKKIGIILCCLVSGFMIGNGYTEVKRYQYEREHSVSICTLKRDLKEGERIKDTDIESIRILEGKKEFVPFSIGQCKGKFTKTSLKKGTVLCQEFLCMENPIRNRNRRVPYSFIRNTQLLESGDYVDVRISFPNGADYIVLSKKKLEIVPLSKTDSINRVWLAMNEEEILRMSSSIVDAYLFDGAYLYATLYTESTQDESIVNYPVNETVEEVMSTDPNILEKAQTRLTKNSRKNIIQNSPRREVGYQQAEEKLPYFH